MEFIPAGELLGATTRVRQLTIKGAPKLPDGTYALLDGYCTDLSCDCRKTMIQVHLDGRFVSLINFGWESPAFYSQWYGNELDEMTLKEMVGPSIDLGSPNRVDPQSILQFFCSILDNDYKLHFQKQYSRFKEALKQPTAERILNKFRAKFSGVKKPSPNQPCPCGSGKKYKRCCGR